MVGRGVVMGVAAVWVARVGVAAAARAPFLSGLPTHHHAEALVDAILHQQSILGIAHTRLQGGVARFAVCSEATHVGAHYRRK